MGRLDRLPLPGSQCATTYATLSIAASSQSVAARRVGSRYAPRGSAEASPAVARPPDWVRRADSLPAASLRCGAPHKSRPDCRSRRSRAYAGRRSVATARRTARGRARGSARRCYAAPRRRPPARSPICRGRGRARRATRASGDRRRRNRCAGWRGPMPWKSRERRAGLECSASSSIAELAG